MGSKVPVKPQIQKQGFERNVNGKDGLLLQVHHTVPGSNGDIRRTRFLLAAFSSCDELLAVADHRGSVFIIDLANNLFWQLVKLECISVVAFHSHKKAELIIGHGDKHLSLLDSGSGAQIGSLAGHSKPPFQLSFSSDGHFGLSVASCEGFIWDFRSLTQAHRLNLQTGMSIKIGMFMPESDNILACFQDDAIHVWAFETFLCVKQIVPDTWKDNSIRSIAFTRNGRAMVVGGSSNVVVVFVVDDWSVQRTLLLPSSVRCVHHLEFVPEPFDCGANKILAVLTDTGSLYFIDINVESIWRSENVENVNILTSSKAGKYIACNMSSGVVKIFSSTKLLENCEFNRGTRVRNTQIPLSLGGKGAVTAEERYSKKKPTALDHMPLATLDINRLRPILREFFEYPEQYRSLIWRSILQLPGNREPWESLAKRPLHPSASNISRSHAIRNKTALGCLQSVISCLAYWSPVFGELPYLPHFVFPFVKVFHSDKFVCFEVIATVIVNWCQHWFEYLSFPPVNVLGMIENILSEHDSGLITLFCKSNVTSRQFAWSLLSTAFSEVLPCNQWLQLWDHVLSNPPCFLLFAVAAYSICCRASLKTCVSKEDFEFFFHHQNPINMRQFLKKCYEIMDTTSSDNHPKQYFKEFEPLSRGNYPVFSSYPKFIVDFQKERRKMIRQEEEKILKEQHEIVSQSLAREELRLRESKARLHDSRLLAAERAVQAALQAEEDGLARRRKELLALQTDLRCRERDSIAKATVDIMEQQALRRCAELDRLHQELHNKAEQAATTAQTMSAEWQDHFNRLAAKKQDLEQRLKSPQPDHVAQALAHNLHLNSNLSGLKEQQQCLRDKINKRPADSPDRLAELESLKQRVAMALAQQAGQQEHAILQAEQSIQEAHQEAQLQQLSEEVKQLMDRLTSRVMDSKPCGSSFNSRMNDSPCSLGLTAQQMTKLSESVPVPMSRQTHLYDEERSAVANAMELRQSLLSGWNSH